MQDLTLLGIKQIASLYGKSEQTISKWAKAGILPEPHLKAGKNWYWTAEQIAKTKERKGNNE